MERCNASGSRSMSRAYIFACRNSAKEGVYLGYGIKSSLMIYETWGTMRYTYRNRQCWCREDYADTVGKNEKAIAQYIQKTMARR